MKCIVANFAEKKSCVDVVYNKRIVVAYQTARYNTKGVDYQSIVGNHYGFSSNIAVALGVAKMNKQQEQK